MFSRKIFLLFFFLLTAHCLLPTFSFSQGTWVQKANVFTTGRAGVVGFSIGNKGYFGTGWQYSNYIYYVDFWEWDQTTNAWTQKANFPGTARGDAVGFSIGNFGYIGTGRDNVGNYKNDFWEWNQATNTWALKATIPGPGRAFGIGFSISTKGYVGVGIGAADDFWEWNQATNTWTQKANFGGGSRYMAVGFSINAKGYIGTGASGVAYCNDFWEYDPSVNSWTQKANFPGAARGYASGFSIGNKGFVGTGADLSGNILDDFWEWDQITNTWSQKANYPHAVTDIDHASFSIGCKGYFGTGADDPGSAGIYYDDFWEFNPDNAQPVNAVVSGNSVICFGNSSVLSASGGSSYSWSTGDVTNTITVSPTVTTTYSVTVSTGCGSATVNTIVTVVNSGTASFTYEYQPCENNCVKFADQSVNAFSWCWGMGDGTNLISQNPCWVYPSSATYNPSLIINCNTACADTFSVAIPYESHDTSAFIYIPNAFSPNGDGSNDVLNFQIKDDFCLKEFEITIYDRWGEKVFQTTDISDSWDGIFNGKKLDSQALAYYCKTNTTTDRQIIRKGTISLIR